MRHIDKALLAEFRRAPRCEWCGKSPLTGLDPHHIFARGMGGGKRLDIRCNLIALCRVCHTLKGDGELNRCDLLAVAAVREGLLQPEIERVVQRLRRLPKECRLCPACDGIGFFWGRYPKSQCDVCAGYGAISQDGLPPRGIREEVTGHE